MKHQKPNFQTNTFLYGYARCVIRPILDVLSHLESRGNENIPEQGGVLLVSNHTSLLDPVIVGAAASRELHYLGEDTYFDIPWFGWLLTKLNGFPVKRGSPDRQALREALSRLETGKALLVFPEGTRSTTGTLGEIKKGASFIIHHANVPVIPVFIQGSARFMPRGAKFIRPAKLVVTFGPPIDFTGLEGIEQKQALYQRMSEQIKEALMALQNSDGSTHRPRGIK